MCDPRACSVCVRMRVFDSQFGCVRLQYDQTFSWLQFITPERILSIRPEDRYDDLREWISALGNKQNTNSGKRETKAKKKKPEVWEDFVLHEFGMVTSDLGCSFHGMKDDGTLNENDMIGYVAKGDALKLINWPDKTVTIDKYGCVQSDPSGPMQPLRTRRAHYPVHDGCCAGTRMSALR